MGLFKKTLWRRLKITFSRNLFCEYFIKRDLDQCFHPSPEVPVPMTWYFFPEVSSGNSLRMEMMNVEDPRLRISITTCRVILCLRNANNPNIFRLTNFEKSLSSVFPMLHSPSQLKKVPRKHSIKNLTEYFWTPWTKTIWYKNGPLLQWIKQYFFERASNHLALTCVF